MICPAARQGSQANQWPGSEGGAVAGGLLTDLYELNMAASYLRRGMDGRRRSACSSGASWRTGGS